jgi:hypothetical protein
MNAPGLCESEPETGLLAKYNGKDFEIAGKEKEGMSFECAECGERYEDATEFSEATTYKNTSYMDIDPEPNMELSKASRS